MRTRPACLPAAAHPQGKSAGGETGEAQDGADPAALAARCLSMELTCGGFAVAGASAQLLLESPAQVADWRGEAPAGPCDGVYTRDAPPCTPPTPPDGYEFRAGQDATSGASLGDQPGASPADLAAACEAKEGCAGFSSSGALRGAWEQLAAVEGDCAAGIYVRNAGPGGRWLGVLEAGSGARGTGNCRARVQAAEALRAAAQRRRAIAPSLPAAGCLPTSAPLAPARPQCRRPARRPRRPRAIPLRLASLEERCCERWAKACPWRISRPPASSWMGAPASRPEAR